MMDQKIELWKTGTPCLYRGVNRGHIFGIHSVTVVRDSLKEAVLLLLPSVQCMLSAGYINWRNGNRVSQSFRWKETNIFESELTSYTWHTNRMLIFLRPEKYYANCLFWHHETNKFVGYYINFQLSFTRTITGFDTLDLDINIVIDPDGSWLDWKPDPLWKPGKLIEGWNEIIPSRVL